MNMKRTCLGAFIGMITALMTTSCITGQSGYEEVGDNIPVTFTMSTPAGEAVPYTQQTRATHDEAEWTIHKLTLYVYSVDDDDQGTFLRSYSTDAEGDRAISIVPNGAGTYTFTLKAPVSDLKARQRFVFVANDSFPTPRSARARTNSRTSWPRRYLRLTTQPTNSPAPTPASPCRALPRASRRTSLPSYRASSAKYT